VPIPFSKKSRRNVIDPLENGDATITSKRVGLRPSADWHKRNFLTSVLIPSLFTKRAGKGGLPLFPKVRAGEICITWVGHASFLIQTKDVNILIDPNWSMWLKVIKRLKKPGFDLFHLPEIDFVLVTHAHFDHLDRRTLRKVAADQPIVVPVGVGNLVHDLGFNIVHELDHWQRIELGPLCVSMTPCHHWGARMLHDSHRGFGGFLIEAEGRSIFHCGDSAYFDGFQEIGKRFDIEIALLPIGAYDPRSIMRAVHMNPAEAVQARADLSAARAIGMHFGTFQLTDEGIEAPVWELAAARATAGLLPDAFDVLGCGETRELPLAAGR